MAKKHKDFLDHVAANRPDLHAKITAHPDFDATKHNSLGGAMKLDGALSDEDCNDVLDSIMSAKDEHGFDQFMKLLTGEDAKADQKEPA